MARYRSHTLPKAVRDQVLDAWATGVGIRPISKAVQLGENAVNAVINRARLDKDPRALRAPERKIAVAARLAELASAPRERRAFDPQRVTSAVMAGVPPEPDGEPGCQYRLARSMGIEPVERLIANRNSLGSNGAAFVAVTVARIPTIDGHKPFNGR